jgi:hypothetical protein
MTLPDEPARWLSVGLPWTTRAHEDRGGLWGPGSSGSIEIVAVGAWHEASTTAEDRDNRRWDVDEEGASGCGKF